MKGISALILTLCITPCFAEEITLYNENGLSLSYNYEKIGTIKDPDCPDMLFDEYKASAKVQNSNNKAVTFDETDWLVARIAFVSYGCTKFGKLTSQQSNYFLDLFHNHHVYGTGTPNTGFGTVHPYFLDPNDIYISSFAVIRMPSGEPFPKPEWHFPEWKFINIPNQKVATQNIATTNKNVSQPTNTKESYEKLIVGKWKHTQTSSLINGKERVDPYVDKIIKQRSCFDIYEANKNYTGGIGDCSDTENIGKWSIYNNILSYHFPPSESGYLISDRYEILQLDELTLKIKTTNSDDGKLTIFTYQRVK